MLSSTSTATRIAALAFVLALAAFLYLCFADTYSGTTSDGVTVEHTSSTIIEENGLGIVAVLAAPLAVAGAGVLFSAGRSLWSWAGLWLTAALGLGFSVLAMLSVGMFYAPAAIGLVIAAAKNGRPVSHRQTA